MSGSIYSPDLIEPPARLGRYEIREVLGTGTRAKVFAAYDTELERHVALKVFRRANATPDIDREARALARVDHPNVIKLHEIGEADRSVFLVLDLVRGRTLLDYICEQHHWCDVVMVFIEAARGLAAVHAAGLVHGDVGPDNILVGHDGRVQIVDLGHVRSVGDVRFSPTRCSAAADQYALCLMLWQALYDVRLDIPRGLLRVLDRGLAFMARDRFEDMNALADALTCVLVDARRRTAWRRVLALTIAAALLILVFALLVLHAMDSTGRWL